MSSTVTVSTIKTDTNTRPAAATQYPVSSNPTTTTAALCPDNGIRKSCKTASPPAPIIRLAKETPESAPMNGVTLVEQQPARSCGDLDPAGVRPLVRISGHATDPKIPFANTPINAKPPSATAHNNRDDKVVSLSVTNIDEITRRSANTDCKPTERATLRKDTTIISSSDRESQLGGPPQSPLPRPAIVNRSTIVVSTSSLDQNNNSLSAPDRQQIRADIISVTTAAGQLGGSEEKLRDCVQPIETTTVTGIGNNGNHVGQGNTTIDPRPSVINGLTKAVQIQSINLPAPRNSSNVAADKTIESETKRGGEAVNQSSSQLKRRITLGGSGSETASKNSKLATAFNNKNNFTGPSGGGGGGKEAEAVRKSVCAVEVQWEKNDNHRQDQFPHTVEMDPLSSDSVDGDGVDVREVVTIGGLEVSITREECETVTEGGVDEGRLIDTTSDAVVLTETQLDEKREDLQHEPIIDKDVHSIEPEPNESTQEKGKSKNLPVDHESWS